MSQFCQSCAMPMEEAHQDRAYCENCSDAEGKLLPKEQVKQGIAGWFASWQPGGDFTVFAQRAESYMKAMPAWADK